MLHLTLRVTIGQPPADQPRPELLVHVAPSAPYETGSIQLLTPTSNPTSNPSGERSALSSPHADHQVLMPMDAQFEDDTCHDADKRAAGHNDPTQLRADDPEVLANPLDLAGPQMRRRANEYTEWSYRVVPGTLADLMSELDKIYDGERNRFQMRDQEEVSGIGWCGDVMILMVWPVFRPIYGCGIM